MHSTDLTSYESEQSTLAAGYRLQLTLTDLADLALQIQHVRWNLPRQPALRARWDDLEALCRAGADAVAARMNALGVAPDGRVATNHHDLLFDPLSAGPFSPENATAELVHRVSQFGARVKQSLAILDRADPDSAEILRAISTEFAEWPREASSEPEDTPADP